MPEPPHKTSDVFGINRDLPLNYVDRAKVDDYLVDYLTRDRHIVIYGSSKQGKTSLRKHCLQDKDYITVHCSNKSNLGDIHAAILKQAGYQITQSTTKSAGGRFKVNLSVIAADAEGNKNTTTTPLEMDVEDVNDVIAALKAIQFNQFIVLEDFHYLQVETQRDFAVALKAFHEASPFCFIIVGVWLDENRLIVYNGDLTGRIVSINADSWIDPDLRRVITAGEYLLNVSFHKPFVDELIAGCSESVYIVQEVCYQACKYSSVWQTLDEQKDIGQDLNVPQLIKDVVDEQSGRYNSFLVQFADGFQDTELEMYRWLLYPVITAKPLDLERGLRLPSIRKAIVTKHPRGQDLNPGNLTQALQSAASLQIKKDIKPIILDYDQTNLRLNIVDKGFVIWLSHQDTQPLLKLIDLDA